jgi:hypothetical protein
VISFQRVAVSAICVIAVLILLAVTANAQDMPICMPRERLQTELRQAYQEVPISGGMLSTGVLLEIYAKLDGGSFSMVVTDPAGEACVIRVGSDWVNRMDRGVRS